MANGYNALQLRARVVHPHDLKAALGAAFFFFLCMLFRTKDYLSARSEQAFLGIPMRFLKDDGKSIYLTSRFKRNWSYPFFFFVCVNRNDDKKATPVTFLEKQGRIGNSCFLLGTRE